MLWYTVAAGFAIIILFSKPLRPILKALFRSALALPAIAVFNLIAGNFGFFLGANILNAALIGFLGLPGALSVIALGMLF